MTMTEIIAPFSPQADYVLPPAGGQPAICYQVIYLGTQQTTYMGDPKLRKMIKLTFELHDEMMPDGRPFSVSKDFTFSSNEKANLRLFIEVWRGKNYTDDELMKLGGLPISKLVGQTAYVTITHDVSAKNNRTYGNLQSAIQLPKGMPVPKQINESIIYSIDGHNQDVFEKLSSYDKTRIEASIEWQQKFGDKHAPIDTYHDNFEDSEIPF